jgi:hypothetical protein
MTDPLKQAKTNQYVLIAMSLVLIFGAYTAVMVTGSEYDPAGIVWLNLALDAGMTVLAVILGVQVIRAPDAAGLKVVAILIGAVGFLAGLVQLAVRFSSDHGWWTGHYTYAL